jgi:hypothetical protein
MAIRDRADGNGTKILLPPLTHPISMPRPRGVVAIASLFFAAAGYLLVIGCLMLTSPGLIGMRAGAPLLSGLELAGPYAFLIATGVGGLIGWGLLSLNNWTRRAAVIIALLGVVMLIPSVSSAVVDFHASALAWSGLAVITRVVVAWYLWQAPVVEAFKTG